MSLRRELADEFGEFDEECDSNSSEKAKEVPTRRPAQRKRLMKRERAEEEKSHAECPKLGVLPDTHAVSSQISRNAKSDALVETAERPRPQTIENTPLTTLSLSGVKTVRIGSRILVVCVVLYNQTTRDLVQLVTW